MKKDAIYCRQSLDKKDSLSIEGQTEKCLHIVNGEYEVYEDKGFSGKNVERPNLKRLIKDMENNKISRIIVYRLDRISRNISDFYNLYEIMKEHDVDFVSVSEHFDTSTPVGRAMMGILIVFAQMERESIQERVKDNYYYRIAQDGRWAGGPAPYGFRNARTIDNKPTLEINEDEIEAVKLIFREYSENVNISLGKLATMLSEQGYKSRKRDTFDNVTIARILQSPVYCEADEKLYRYYNARGIKFLNDEELWNGTVSAHLVGKKTGNSNTRKYTSLKEQSIYLTNFEGIIDSTTFINVQKRLAENEQICRANAPSNMKELAGLVKCAKCGYAVKMNSKPYLSCYGKVGLHLCTAHFKGIRLHHIQDAVNEEVNKVLLSMQKLDEEKKQLAKEQLEKARALEKERDNLLEVIAKSPILEDVILNKVETIQREINELLLDVQINEDFQFVENFWFEYNTLGEEDKKQVIRLLIEKILLSENGDIEIKWKIAKPS